MRVLVLGMWGTFSQYCWEVVQSRLGGGEQERVWWETVLFSSYSGSQHRTEGSLYIVAFCSLRLQAYDDQGPVCSKQSRFC